jgi:hypothetical protein
MQNISLFLLLFSDGQYYKNPLFSVNGLPLNFKRKINNFLLISKLWMYIYPLKYCTNKANYKQTQSPI